MQALGQQVQHHVEADVRALLDGIGGPHPAEVDEGEAGCLFTPQRGEIEHEAAHHLGDDHEDDEAVEDEHQVALAVVVDLPKQRAHGRSPRKGVAPPPPIRSRSSLSRRR